MNGSSPAARALIVSGLCLGLVAATAWPATSARPAPTREAWPAPEEIDSLARYLAPSRPAPRLDDYETFLPAPAPPVRIVARPRAPEAAPPHDWRLSAILISGERPLAIVDDLQLRPGERLPGGAQLFSIERDHVVIREVDGTRRTLRLPAGIEGPRE